MTGRYFALKQDGTLVPVGHCTNHRDAAKKQPNAVWLFTEHALAKFVIRARGALAIDAITKQEEGVK